MTLHPQGIDDCRCGDSDCVGTFGRATAGQDRSGCCQYCGLTSCDVCGWTALPLAVAATSVRDPFTGPAHHQHGTNERREN